MLTPYVWMFISSYESLRHYVLQNTNISGLIQLEYNAFEAACVPVATFILHNTDERYKGNYIKLSDFKGAENQAPKTIEAIQNHNCGYYFETSTENFSKIPGSPIAYWVSRNFLLGFVNNKKLEEKDYPKQGLITGDNLQFLRLWYEVCNLNIDFYCSSCDDSAHSGIFWFPYNKGGDFRKWYGNNDYIVNWKNDGYEIKHFIDNKGKLRSRPQNTNCYFKEHVTWSKISSSKISFRLKNIGSIFSDAGCAIILSDNDKWYVLGLLNSIYAQSVFDIINPTINYTQGTIASLPYKEMNKQIVDKLAVLGIKISDERNNIRGEEKLISSDDSSVPVYIIPTNEEVMIARDTYNLAL